MHGNLKLSWWSFTKVDYQLQLYKGKHLLYTSNVLGKDHYDKLLYNSWGADKYEGIGGDFEVRFVCKEEICNNGAIEFRLVSCGCPSYQAVKTPCVYKVSNRFDAEDAVCGPPDCPKGEHAIASGQCGLCPAGTAKWWVGPGTENPKENKCYHCEPGS